MNRALLFVLLLGCNKTVAAPDASSVTSASASASAPAPSVSIGRVAVPKTVGDLVGVVKAWNDATNAHDPKKLGALYADDVELYGTKMSRAKAVAVKDAAFAKHDHDDLGPITVTGNTATFDKTSKSKDGKTIQVSAYIDVDASMKIIAEGDTTTDANLTRKKMNDCSGAIVKLVESTPEGKKASRNRAWTEPPATSSGTWKVNFTEVTGGQRFDENTIQGFQAWSDVFQVDTKTGTVVFVGTSVSGPTDMEYSMTPSGKRLVADATAAAKVAAICN